MPKYRVTVRRSDVIAYRAVVEVEAKSAANAQIKALAWAQDHDEEFVETDSTEGICRVNVQGDVVPIT